jgi:hypothetical protein
LWGGVEGQSSRECSGKCDPGFYCPEASTSPKQVPCGHANVFWYAIDFCRSPFITLCLSPINSCQFRTYSPTGSSTPTQVVTGFYSIHTGAYSNELALEDPMNETMSAQLVCPPGYWCKHGKKFHCPAGSFGWTFGLTEEVCSGFCKGEFAMGYFLMTRSSSSSLWKSCHLFLHQLM